jgi:hypothetical protein
MQAVMGTLVKRFLGHQMGLKPEAIYHCAVMPCYDKKLEGSREDFCIPGNAHHIRLNLVAKTQAVHAMCNLIMRIMHAWGGNQCPHVGLWYNPYTAVDSYSSLSSDIADGSQLIGTCLPYLLRRELSKPLFCRGWQAF